MIVLNQPRVVPGVIQPGLEDMSGGSPGIMIGHSYGLASADHYIRRLQTTLSFTCACMLLYKSNRI